MELAKKDQQTAPVHARLERQVAEEDSALLGLEAYLAQTRLGLSTLRRERKVLTFERLQAWRKELTEREVRLEQLLASRTSQINRLNLLTDWTKRLADLKSEIEVEYRVRHRSKRGLERATPRRPTKSCLVTSSSYASWPWNRSPTRSSNSGPAVNREVSEPIPFGRRGFQRAVPIAVDPNTIELGVLFAGLRRNKWLILGGVLLSAGVAAVVFETPSRSTIPGRGPVETRQEQLSGIEQVISDLTVSDAVVAGEIAVLAVEPLDRPRRRQLNLTEHPEFDPHRLSQPSSIERLFEWAKLKITVWRGLETEPRPEVISPSDLEVSSDDARNLAGSGRSSAI